MDSPFIRIGAEAVATPAGFSAIQVYIPASCRRAWWICRKLRPLMLGKAEYNQTLVVI